MEETGSFRLQAYLDPLAEEFRPRTTTTTFSPHPQITLLQPQIYYPYHHPSPPPLQVMAPLPPPPPPPPPVSYQQQPLMNPAAYFRPNGVQLPPASSVATRSLLLSYVPVDVTEGTVRRELEVFGEVRAVEMERLVHEGILTVHFFDLRHAEAALMEIQAQHMQLQNRLRQHYYNNNHYHPLLISSWGGDHHSFSSSLLPPPCPGLIAGRAVWAQFIITSSSPSPTMSPAVPDWVNQGTIVVFNLDFSVSGSRVQEIFQAFGAVKELRETPLKRTQRFVEFFDVRDAAKALSEMNGKEINGQSILIEFSRPGGNRRRGFVNPSSSSSSINNSFYSRISNYQNPSPPPPPLSVPLKLFRRSNSNSSSSNSSPQSQRSGKKSGFGSGGVKNSTTTTTTPRFHGGCRSSSDHHGVVVAEIVSPMSCLSVGHSRNGSSEEGSNNNCNESASSSSSRSRRNSRKNSNGDKVVEKQRKTYPWKIQQNRPKILSDARFLIDESAAMGSSSIRDPRTTIMIKNIPNKYSQKLLLNMLDNHCIHCNEQIISSKGDQGDHRQPMSAYDFLYLPIDFNNKCNVGYGFVNMTSPQATWRLYKAFHLQPWEVFNSRKICEVTYARLQGLEALKEHFKNSKFACETDDYLPVVFSPPRDGKNLTEPVPMGSGQGQYCCSSDGTAVTTTTTTTTTLGTLNNNNNNKRVLLLGGGDGSSSLLEKGGGSSEEGYCDAVDVVEEEEGGDGDEDGGDEDVGRSSSLKETQEVMVPKNNNNKVVFGGKKRNGGSNGCLVSRSEPQTQPNKALLMSSCAQVK